jgi:Protein of unknown function (DUF1479)
MHVYQHYMHMCQQVTFSQLQDGSLPLYVARQLNRRGVIVVREAVTEPMALRWRDKILEYLLNNSQWVRPPVKHPRYWAHAQLSARENERVNAVFTALNSLWHTRPQTAGHYTAPVNLQTSLTYCDMLSIGKPCSPHAAHNRETGACSGVPLVERWSDPRFRSVYSAIFDGTFEQWDPFDASLRAAFDEASVGRAGGAFRPWQGFLSLSPWLQHSGNLHIVPMMRVATSYALLRPFMSDVPADNMCGADGTTAAVPAAAAAAASTAAAAAAYSRSTSSTSHGDAAFQLSEQYHKPLLDALVSLPALQPGDLVLWHPDIVIAESDPQELDREFVSLFVSSMPVCEGNSQYLVAQRRAFHRGLSPHNRGVHMQLAKDESDFKDRGKPSYLQNMYTIVCDYSTSS